MNFPGNILSGISRFLKGDGDEILIYVLVFLFFFLTGTNRSDEKYIDNTEYNDEGIPFILIVIFLFFFLSSGHEYKKA